MLFRASPHKRHSAFTLRNLLTWVVVALSLVLALPISSIPQHTSGGNNAPANNSGVLVYPDYDDLSGKELIEMVQRVLKSEGFDPGPIDGILGPKTRRALAAFQEAHDLPVTGELDERTRYQLFWSF